MPRSHTDLDAARALLDEMGGLFDLHIDTFIPPRLWGYDPLRRHGMGLLRGRFFGHLDLPRMRDARVTAAMWSITTNPFRTAASRLRVWQRNRTALQALIERSGGQMQAVATAAALAHAQRDGVHAVLPAIQGANAVQAATDLDAAFADGWVTRVTLVHLTDSVYGATSSPLSLRRDKRLTAAGAALVETLNRHRVWVDLAHAHPQTLADALAVHDPLLPPIATHTGVCGVRPHWRNLDDGQIRALASRGGVIGVIAAANFLRPTTPTSTDDGLGGYLAHLEHIIEVGGEEAAAIGTDLDGAIVPPLDLRDGLGHVRLVAAMLARGWSATRIVRVCRGNAIAAWRRLRPDGWQPAARSPSPSCT